MNKKFKIKFMIDNLNLINITNEDKSNWYFITKKDMPEKYKYINKEKDHIYDDDYLIELFNLEFNYKLN